MEDALGSLMYILLVFIAVGAALNVFYMASGAGKSLTKQERYEEAFDPLNLNAAQKGAVLTLEQWNKFQALREVIRQEIK